MKKYNKIVIIIPAFNPDEKLLNITKELINAGFPNMILVNDGSDEKCHPIFEAVQKLFAVGG